MASWGPLGGLLGPPRALLAAPGMIFGLVLALLGAVFRSLRRCWVLLDIFWDILAGLGVILGRLSAEGPYGVLGTSGVLGRLGASWARC